MRQEDYGFLETTCRTLPRAECRRYGQPGAVGSFSMRVELVGRLEPEGYPVRYDVYGQF
jgi:hypothetical protein